MAEIFLGKAIGADNFIRLCAFKRILPHHAKDDDFINMFRQEAMIVKQFQNKNIVQVYDFVSSQDTYMLVMEFVNGVDLRSILMQAEKLNKPIPVEVAAFIATEILSGLNYAHQAKDIEGVSQNIVHRDISPQNILISFEGDVKITDFGIAKAQNQTSSTQAGVIKGKFRYMSPEQASGDPLDGRSDIFATGILLFEMLTMTRLFKGDDLTVLENVRNCKINPPSELSPHEIPPELDAIVLKMLAKETKKRYLKAQDAAKDITKFLYSFKKDFYSAEVSEYLSSLFEQKIKTNQALISSVLSSSSDESYLISQLDPLNESNSFHNALNSPKLFQDKHMEQKPKNKSESGKPIPSSLSLPKERENISHLSIVRNNEPKSSLQVHKTTTHRPLQKSTLNVNYARSKGRSTSSSNSSLVFVSLLLGAIFLWILKIKGFYQTSNVSIIMNPLGPVEVTLQGKEPILYKDPPVLTLKASRTTHIHLEKLGYKPVDLNIKTGLFKKNLKETIIFDPVPNSSSIRINTVPTNSKISWENGKILGTGGTIFGPIPTNQNYDLEIKSGKCKTFRTKIFVPQKSDKKTLNFRFVLPNC